MVTSKAHPSSYSCPVVSAGDWRAQRAGSTRLGWNRPWAAKCRQKAERGLGREAAPRGERRGGDTEIEGEKEWMFQGKRMYLGFNLFLFWTRLHGENH